MIRYTMSSKFAAALICAALLFSILALDLCGCVSQEAIVGTWRNPSTGTQIKVEQNGTYSYLKDNQDEVHYLAAVASIADKYLGGTGDLGEKYQSKNSRTGGSWELLADRGTANVGGADFQIYLYIPNDRVIEGDGDKSVGNVYSYSDSNSGDYYFLVGGDEAYVVINAAALDSFIENGGPDNSSAGYKSFETYCRYERV